MCLNCPSLRMPGHAGLMIHHSSSLENLPNRWSALDSEGFSLQSNNSERESGQRYGGRRIWERSPVFIFELKRFHVRLNLGFTVEWADALCYLTEPALLTWQRRWRLAQCLMPLPSSICVIRFSVWSSVGCGSSLQGMDVSLLAISGTVEISGRHLARFSFLCLASCLGNKSRWSVGLLWFCSAVCWGCPRSTYLK